MVVKLPFITGTLSGAIASFFHFLKTPEEFYPAQGHHGHHLLSLWKAVIVHLGPWVYLNQDGGMAQNLF